MSKNNKNNNNKTVEEEVKVENPVSFSTKRLDAKNLKTFYDDETTRGNRLNQPYAYKSLKLKKAEEVRNILQKAINSGIASTQKQVLIETSTRLYMTNPVYKSIIDYFAKFFIYRYKVIPHRLMTNSRVKKLNDSAVEKKYDLTYREMLEVVDGIGIETIYPEILVNLYTQGSVYLTTVFDKERFCVSTLLLPPHYCKTIAQTQYGTTIIQFRMDYFDSLGYVNTTEAVNYIKTAFSEEFADLYKKYKKDPKTNLWQTLDPRFSTAIMLNPEGIPYLLYTLGSIGNYEQYQDNELERNGNLLKYLVVQTMPHFQNDLIFTVDEVQDLHRSLRNKIEVDDKARLITTWGEVHVEKISDTDSSDSDVTAKAYRDIFNNAGLNSTIFTSDSVEALKMAIRRDKSVIYTYVEAITNFYIIAVNNGWDWKNYQADIEILPISNYTYNDDIKIYKDNATLGVNKLDYFIASGTKQKNIQDQLILEDYLHLNDLKPMQTSYTQSGNEESDESKDDKTLDSKNSDQADKESGIEPSDDKKQTKE